MAQRLEKRTAVVVDVTVSSWRFRLRTISIPADCVPAELPYTVRVFKVSNNATLVCIAPSFATHENNATAQTKT